MKKLVTALIIVLPLIFVVALFAVTSVVSISTSIPVTGIEIGNIGENGTFSFDISDYSEGNRLYEDDLAIQVLPSVAANKGYHLASVTDVETSEPTNIVSLAETEDGRKYFDLHGVGNAKLTYETDEGGYQASVQFVITSTDVLSFVPVLTTTDADGNSKTIELKKGSETDYVAEIETGTYKLSTLNNPVSVSTNTRFIKEDGIADINEVTGDIKARFSGKTTITVKVGRSEEHALTATVLLDVRMKGSFTINGDDASDKAHPLTVMAPKESDTFSMNIEVAERGISPSDIALRDSDGNPIDITATRVTGSETAFSIIVTRNGNEADIEQYTLTVGVAEYTFNVQFDDYIFTLSSSVSAVVDDTLVIRATEESVKLSVSFEPENDKMIFKWAISKGEKTIVNFGEKSSSGYYRNLEPITPGEAELTIKCYTLNELDKESFSHEIKCKILVVRTVNSLSFAENGKTYGMSNTLAIASSQYPDNAVGDPTDYYYTADLSVSFADGSKTPDLSDIEFTLSDDSLAEYKLNNNKLTIHAKQTGLLSVTASWKYGQTFGVAPATLTLQTVNGVMVGKKERQQNASGGWEEVSLPETAARDQLMRAMKEEKAVVMQQNVYLGEDLYERAADGTRVKRKYKNDEDMYKIASKYVKELETTWDWTYYKNIGEAKPNIKYALEITADIYGNGNMINAEYLTNMLDDTDKPTYAVFKGPLDFVAMEGVAAVKGQDNIVFLVRKKGLTVSNTQLLGCNDNSFMDGDGNNLSLLNYTGTTLEVMNDFTLVNSRVRNGRTVMRVYGKDGVDQSKPVDAAAEKINVTIDNCQLQNAREFILKIGTNRFVRYERDPDASVDENPEPSLYDKNGKEYTGYNSAECDARITPGNAKYDQDFVDNFVLTDVVLKNSTLSTSGLFSIGMESHFAGKMLAGGMSGMSEILKGWSDLAATSYPAVLHLVGDVILDDWKNLDNVDSSTLIEILANDQSTSGMKDYLQLDIKKLLQYVGEYDKKGQYEGLVVSDGGVNWVHGGIAMYGGGKNYHGVDLSQFTFHKFVNPSINISMLKEVKEDAAVQKQGEMLPQAAGTQDFRFFMYDKNSAYQHK